MSDSDRTSVSLLEKVRDNDQLAWQQLVHLYGPLVQRWCIMAKLPESDAADVFQETFRSVSRSLGSYSPSKSNGSFRSWLRTIVRNKITDHFRQKSARAAALGGTDAQIHLANVEDPLADDPVEEQQHERSMIVSRALEFIREEFSDQNWNAFEQVALEGQSAADVARELGVQPQTIRQANYRIRNRLRIVLADLLEEQ